MNLPVKRILGIIFGISVFAYMLIEYKYDIEVLTFFSFLYTFIILINSIKYLKRRKKLIELGELERFHRNYIEPIALIIFVLTLFFVLPRISEWMNIKILRSNFNENFVILVFLPQLIQFFVGIFSKEMGTYFYITEKGIISSMEVKETYFWEDFINYKLLEDQNLLSFKKKKGKNLFISYHKEYFEKNRNEILNTLDNKLKKFV